MVRIMMKVGVRIDINNFVMIVCVFEIVGVIC